MFSRRQLGFWFLCFLILSATGAAAAPPSKADLKDAKRLLADAQKALKRKDFGVAINLLEEAETKVPTLEFALALAHAQEAKGDVVEAWRVVERARAYPGSAKETKSLPGYVLKLEQTLYQDHAFLELDLTPGDATVREKTDGQWTTPHRRWAKRSYSTLRVEAPNFIPATVQWHHPAGHPSVKKVELIPASAYGRVRISGLPAGALILVDDAALGSLPNAETRLLAPGKYKVRVEKDKYIAQEQTVIVRAGDVTQVTVTLEESESGAARLMKSKKFWGWTSVGIGAAALITSGVLLGIAADHQQQGEDLNATHTAGYPDYESEFDAITGDINGLATGGWVSLGIGLLAAGAGTALLVVDSMEKPTGSTSVSDLEPSTDWHLFPTPNGAAAVVRF